MLGADRPLLGHFQGANGLQIHGENGVGGFELPTSTKPFEHEHTSAAQFIAATCAQHPGEVTLITLGPLTNLARALELDPATSGNLHAVSMMAGTVHGGQSGQYGNKAPAAEANACNDPEVPEPIRVRLRCNDVESRSLNPGLSLSPSQTLRLTLPGNLCCP